MCALCAKHDGPLRIGDLPQAVLPFMASLLGDSETDVRILATELARNMPAAYVTHLLCGLLENEQHPNVCAAAIDVLAEVGTRRLFPPLRPAPNDFPQHRSCRSPSRSPSPAFRRRKASIGMARSEAPEARAVHIAQEDVRRLCEFLYRWTGMSFADNKPYYIDRRLAERIAATQSASFQSYFALLRSDADHEIEHLVNAFTVNETYFNREEHQLRCMTSNLLSDVIRGKRPEDPLRIWSVPCSTGEEPYSVAIWLMENWIQVDSYNIEIVGSDIDTRALEAAAAGVYGDRALMRLSRQVVGRYFQPITGDRHQIDFGLEKFHSIHQRQSDRYEGHGAVSGL